MTTGLRHTLLIGDRLDELPEGLTSLPLQQDIDATPRRLRLKRAASVMLLELDLREEGGPAVFSCTGCWHQRFIGEKGIHPE